MRSSRQMKLLGLGASAPSGLVHTSRRLRSESIHSHDFAFIYSPKRPH
jgi:hypothetical protein